MPVSLKPTLPVRWILFFFGIQQTPMVYQAKTDFVSKAALSLSLVCDMLCVVPLRCFCFFRKKFLGRDIRLQLIRMSDNPDRNMKMLFTIEYTLLKIM
jgi:hypothetical protein